MLKTVRLILNVVGWLLLGGIFIGGLYKCVGSKPKKKVEFDVKESGSTSWWSSPIISGDTTIWIDSSGSVSVITEHEMMFTEIKKLKKELLAAIENKKCTCGESLFIIPLPMPDETLPTEIDTASMKILLHSYGTQNLKQK